MRHLVYIPVGIYRQWALDSCCSEVLDYQENLEQEFLKSIICRSYAIVYFISIILFGSDANYPSNSRHTFVLHF
jgi:hypothetical protein